MRAFAIQLAAALFGGVLLWTAPATAASLPVPRGPYAIGVTAFEIIDPGRRDSFAPRPGIARDFMVRVWYPARPSEGAVPVTLWTPAISAALAAAFHLPADALATVGATRTHSFADAAPDRSRAPYPLLIFSHGFVEGFSAQNTVQMEELASDGYVVASIDHPYDGLLVQYPSGRSVTFYARDDFASDMKAFGTVVETEMKATDPAAKRAAFVNAVQDSYLGASVPVWVADTNDTVTFLESSERLGPLSGMIDAQRIGVFGMSFGGAVAERVCTVEAWCKAAVNIDGLAVGSLPDDPIRVPILFFQNSRDAGLNDPVFSTARGPAYMVSVAGSTHLNYTDLSVFPSVFPSLLGTIDGATMEEIMNAYILAFFDRYLKGIPTNALSGASRFQAVTIQTRNGP